MPWNSQLLGSVSLRCLGHLSPDGVPEVLGGDAHRGARHADHRARLVEQLERPVVDVGLIELEVVGEITEKMRHGGPRFPLQGPRHPRSSGSRAPLAQTQLGPRISQHKLCNGEIVFLWLCSKPGLGLIWTGCRLSAVTVSSHQLVGWVPGFHGGDQEQG